MTREGKLLLTAEDRTAKAFDSVDKRLAGISRGFAKARDAASGLAVPTAALLAAAKAAISHADAIGDQAKVLGLTTTAYQELSFAAKQLDVDQQALDVALTKFNKTLGQAKLGSAAAREAFDKLKLNPEQFKSTDQAFSAVAQRLGQVKDQFERTALQAQLFGRDAGPKLAAFVSTSSSAVAQLREEAHRLGVVLDEETIQKADAASKQLDALAMVTKTQLTEALVNLAPVVVKVGEAAAMSAQGLGLLARAIEDAYKASTTFDPSATNEAHLAKVKELQSAYAELNLAIALVEKQGGESSAARISVLSQRRDQVKRELDALEGQPRAIAPTGPQPAIAGNKVPAGGGGGLDPGRDATRRTAEAQAAREAAATDEYLNALYERNIELVSDQDQATREYQASLTDLNELYARGLIPTMEEYDAAVARLDATHAKAGEATAKTAAAAEQSAAGIRDITAAMVEAGHAGENMGDAIANALKRIISEMIMAKALETSDPFLGGVLEGLAGLIDRRASGGPVAANEPYIVGEKGPELIVPRSSGYVVPNDRMASMGQRVSFNPVYNIDARGADPAAAARMIEALRAASAATEARIYDALRRGFAPIR